MYIARFAFSFDERECAVEARDNSEGREENQSSHMVWSWSHGSPVWPFSQTHVVGVFLGHHGARHVLRRLWICYCYVWILHTD